MTARNNPVDLLHNDPDFRAAMWNTDRIVIVKGGRTVPVENGVLPFWCTCYTVESWSVENATLIINLRGKANESTV